ncbi:UbiA family prenyltransferase [Streptomyces sp. NPDC091387]|uniref:UbiA family prenyltransferase n=1 Tax=Streptomyces sp. NPDC091387 TaxID=3365998 RepID=UPI003803A115
MVQLVFLLRFLVGVLCVEASSRSGSARDVMLGSVSLLCAVMASYLVNGVMDVAEDRINGSQRPIASGVLSARAAMKVAGVLAVIALLTASFVPVGIWLVGLILLLGCVYSVPPVAAKRWTTASAAVVMCTGFVTYLAGVAAAGGGAATVPLLFCAVLALWMGFVGAVTKDLSDTHGDEAAGRRTFAVVRGERAARLFVAVSAPVLGAAGLGLALLGDSVVLTGAVPLALGAGWVALRCLRPSPSRVRAPYHAFMITQYSANAGLALGLLAN